MHVEDLDTFEGIHIQQLQDGITGIVGIYLQSHHSHGLFHLPWRRRFNPILSEKGLYLNCVSEGFVCTVHYIVGPPFLFMEGLLSTRPTH